LPNSFAARFRLARQQENLTQVALAHTLRVSQSAVAQWESGRTLPSPAMRSRIEKVLEVDLSATQEEVRTGKRRIPERRPHLPIFGSPAPGDDERILVDEAPRGQIFAPPQLEDVKGASAVYVRGPAMEPRYFKRVPALGRPGNRRMDHHRRRRLDRRLLGRHALARRETHGRG
jgi:transcriptional regulator with XRE-family HTH domain